MVRLWRPAPDRFGSTPEVERLVRALARDRSDEVRQAIAAGADPNAVGEKGLTPLLFAMAHQDNTAAIRELIVSGADPNLSPPGLPDPMALAAKVEGGELLRLMLELGASPDPLQPLTEPYTATALFARQFDNFATLIAAGADVDAMTSPESPLVGLLIELEHWGLAADVLRLGADPDRVLASRPARASLEHDAPAVGAEERQAYEDVLRMLGLADLAGGAEQS